MSQHSSEVLLLVMLFMSSDPQLQESFTQPLLEDPREQLERGLHRVFSSFSIAFLIGLGKVKDLRETVCQLQRL